MKASVWLANGLVSARNGSVWPAKSARMIFSGCVKISIRPLVRR